MLRRIRIALHRPQHLESADFGHLDVEQQNVRPLLRTQRELLATI